MATVQNTYGYLKVTASSVCPEETEIGVLNELDFLDYTPEEIVYAAYWEAFFEGEILKIPQL